MLQKLHLRNFQPHKNLKIIFDRVTFIVGETESGKTAILRALYWICFNKPSGKKFIRWGSKKAGARLTVDEHVVERTRGSENIYKLDGRELKAFGTGVPEPIKKILNIEPENVQHQIDTQTHRSCFWLTLPPSQVSRELNQIIDLSLLDKMLSLLAKKQRATKAKFKVIQERLKQAREQKKKFAVSIKMDGHLKSIESTNRKAEATKTKIEELSIILRVIQLQKQQLKKHFPSQGHQHFQVIEIMMKEVRDLSTKTDRLDSLLCQIKEVEITQTQYTKQLKQTRKELKREMVGKCPVCKRDF